MTRCDAFAAALLLTACARADVVGTHVEGTYTTAPFSVNSEMIWRVKEAHDGLGGLVPSVLYVEAGVCANPLDRLLPVYVYGAPRGTFHVGQMIAQGVPIRGVSRSTIRIVSPREIQQIGCTPAKD